MKEEAKEQFNFNIQNTGQEITIRHGQANAPIEPESLFMQGNIKAPGNYYQTRKLQKSFFGTGDFFGKNKTHIIVNQQDGKITLINDEATPYNQKIEGMAIVSDFAKLVMSGREFTAMELSEVLKKNRRFFLHQDEGMKIILDLKNFKAEWATKIENESDNQGNRLNLFRTSMKNHNAPVTFKLSLPIFAGMPKNEYSHVSCEVCYRIDGSMVKCWIESLQLADNFYDEQQKMISAEIEIFEKDGFTVIYQ